MGSQVEKGGELTNLLDQDEEARLLRALGGGGLAPLLLVCLRRQLGDRFRLEAPEVRVIAREIPAAPVALTAGARLRVLVLAKEELRHRFGERELADAARTVQQDRVRQAVEAALERIEDRLVPG